MKTYITLLFLLCVTSNGFCQQQGSMERRTQPGLEFPDYPLLQLSQKSSLIKLPAVVDNSRQPFLRPVFIQQGPSCEQSASVAYNFCYEINRMRGLHSDTNINQYPSHFVWNFMNSSTEYYGGGVNYFHTFDILHDAGTPTEAIYGSIEGDDNHRWMTGYDGYFQAMHNRISGVGSIHAGTPDGLIVLKHWIYDHLEGAAVGGLANFSVGMPYYPPQIPEGTPEAGKYIQIEFLHPASHALTIVGYNDSIRYDVNGDGLFTNNIDITGDTLVDMKDWEIGGLKYVNSYGIDWADSGFCYMLYRTLALKYGEGGIWNNSVHVLYPDTTAKPLLTIKATVQHNKRGQIRLLAGIVADTSAYYPSKTLSFSVFNYQGDDFFMTGSNTSEGKTLELGLDITPLLSFVRSGEPFRVFLMVDENDPEGSGEGFLLDYSVITYLGQEPIEFTSNDVPLIIINNNRTIASVAVDNSIEPIEILPDSPVVVSPGTNHSVQFSAIGGFPPYTWSLKRVFTETESLAAYNPAEGTMLEPTDNSSGFAEVPLPFSFPFFGKQYDTLYMHVNGYLLFDQQDMPYYYLLFDENYLRQVRAIAGFMNYNLALHANGDYISYNTYPDSVVFNWQISKSAGDGITKFSTTVLPDGRIQHHYGSIDPETTFLPVIGLSDGNRESTFFSVKSGIIPAEGRILRFIPSFLPDKITISEDGLLEIQASEKPFSDKIIVATHDSQRVFGEKSVLLTTGPEINVSLAGSPTLVPPGDVVPLIIEINNRGNDTITGLVVDVKALSLNAGIIGNDFGAIDLLPGQSVVLDSEFSVQISDTLSHPQLARIDVSGTMADFIFHTYKEIQVDLPVIVISPPIVHDGNNQLLEPGEEASLIFKVFNYGRASAGKIKLTVSTDDPLVGFSGSSSRIIDALEGLSVRSASYTINVNTTAPLGRKIPMKIHVYNDENLLAVKEFELEIGHSPIAVYDITRYHNYTAALRNGFDTLNTNYSFNEVLEDDLLNNEIVFLNLGFGSSTVNITPTQDSLLAEFLDGGGKLFVEAGFWFYNQSMLKDRLHIEAGIEAINIPPDTILGREGSLVSGFQFDYSGPFNYILDLLPIEPAVAWLTDKNSGLNFTVALDHDNYRTITSTVYFGGLQSFVGPGKNELLHRYLDFFGYNISPLAANFKADSTFICKGSSVHFEPFCSGNPINYHWLFEGGTPNSFDGPNPVITYENPGRYRVSLTVNDGISDNTFSLNDFILVDDCLGIIDISISKLRLYPNPASEWVNLNTQFSSGKNAVVSISDVFGRILLIQAVPEGVNEIQIPVSKLASGSYIITLSDENRRSCVKMLH